MGSGRSEDRAYAAGVAYEVEAPLARAVARIATVIEGIERGEPGDYARDLRLVADEASRAIAAVRGLARFADDAHHEEGELVDLHEAIEVAVQLTQREVGRRAVLKRRYAPLPMVRGSARAVTRVLVSLLRNAAEAIPGSSPNANTITIQTGIDARGCAVIDVVDTGVGIEPADVPLVFDPFFTTKPRPHAIGLGLAAARATISDMGGTIRVESMIGRGSRFTLTLPADIVHAERPLPFFIGETPPTRRVLCVAETHADARRLGEMLDDDDPYVLYMTCDEAVEELAIGEPYDLVMCEARAAAKSDLRARVRKLAPQALEHMFDLTLRKATSGIYTRVELVPAETATK
jgi:hypothetical protein